MSDFALPRQYRSDGVGKARVKPSASQMLGRCLRVLFVFSSCSPLVLPPSLQRPYGISTAPVPRVDSPGWAAIQMESHFSMNLLRAAARRRFVFPSRGIEVGFVHAHSRCLFSDGTTALVLTAQQGVFGRRSRVRTASAGSQSGRPRQGTC